MRDDDICKGGLNVLRLTHPTLNKWEVSTVNWGIGYVLIVRRRNENIDCNDHRSIWIYVRLDGKYERVF